MESIKTVAVTFCTLLIIIGFTLKMLPRGPLDKNMKIIISLMLLLVIISPLINNFSSKNIEVPSKPQVTSSKEIDPDAIYIAAVDEFKSRVENELKNEGYTYNSVVVSYTKTGKEIAINKVTITVPDTTKSEKIKKLIYNKFLAPVSVIKEGKDNA